MIENATELDSSFLINELGYKTGLSDKDEKILFDDYYLKTCQYINEHHFTRPNIETIEKVLNNKYIPMCKNYSIICSVSTPALCKRIFKLAMAKQLIYDLENGRTSMQKGDQSFSVCPEFKQHLSMLGFVQSGMYSRVGQ